MKPSSLFVIPFALQGLAMVVDEFYFHLKRGLPRWERIGHPLDTVTVLAPFSILVFSEPSTFWISIYVTLSVFSCLFVTKDEPVHLKECSAAEQWLHSVLFVLHPLVFISAGLIWASSSFLAVDFLQELKQMNQVQLAIISVFLIYQITYWNIYAKSKTGI